MDIAQCHTPSDNWIVTHSGRRYVFEKPSPDMISIDDIAISLSNICRYTGHLNEHYSVAQHSVLVSQIVAPEFALEALLHDASEAFCGDCTSPLKDLLADYWRIERLADLAVRKCFGLPLVESPEVKLADRRMLVSEMLSFGKDPARSVVDFAKYPPADITISALPAPEARALFLDRFNQLTGKPRVLEGVA